MNMEMSETPLYVCVKSGVDAVEIIRSAAPSVKANEISALLDIPNQEVEAYEPDRPAAHDSFKPRPISTASEKEEGDSVEDDIFRWTYVFRLGLKEDWQEVVAKLNENPNVRHADIDKRIEPCLHPNDPNFSQQYGLHKIEIQCPWDFTQGENVLVAVVDTGVDHTHPDLVDNLWKNTGETYGINLFNGSGHATDTPSGHGTKVAGVIAAIGNNQLGVIGTAPKVKIMAVKIFNGNFGNETYAALGIRMAAAEGAQVINCSWSTVGQNPHLFLVEEAVKYAHSKGAACVFSAGSHNDDAAYYSPQNMSKTITVSSININDERANNSNFGSHVDIAAPGDNIYTTSLGGGYDYGSGTSMAAGFVSGAIALIKSYAPHRTFAQIKTILQENASDINTDKPIGDRLNVARIFGKTIRKRAIRSSVVETSLGGFGIKQNGELIHFFYDNGWHPVPVSGWGAPLVPSSLSVLGSKYVAAVNTDGHVIVVYENDDLELKYAVLGKTIAIIPGSLRYSSTRHALFALDRFGSIWYIKYMGGTLKWTYGVIHTWGDPLIAGSLELYQNEELLMGVTTGDKVGILWNDPNGTVMQDGATFSYARISSTNGVTV